VLGRRQEGAQRRRIAFRLVARDAGGHHGGRGDGTVEEGASGCGVAMVAQVDVDDLPVLIEAAEEVAPASTDREQGLVHAPARPDRRAVLACRVDEARGERLHPVVDRARVDRDAALGEPFGHLSVTQAEPEVPADGERDHPVWEAVPAEGRGGPRGHPSATLAATVELALRAIPSRLREPFARAPITLHAVSSSRHQGTA
jgi:hypothetical protein